MGLTSFVDSVFYTRRTEGCEGTTTTNLGDGTMKITATVKIGTEFGSFGGRDVTETKVFTTLVDYDRWFRTMQEFDAEDEIVSVHWDCV